MTMRGNTQDFLRGALAAAGAAALVFAASCGGGAGDGSGDPDTDYTVDFAADAFPPVMPNDPHHGDGSYQSWQKEICLTCHADGVNEAPRVRHEGMSPMLIEGKCRTCHTSTE